MGFFSDLVDLTPHRTVAHEIKEYCARTSLSNAENNLLSECQFNEKQYIWLRNSYNYCVFQALFVALNSDFPNSYFNITKSTLDSIIHDVFHTKYAVEMLEELDVPLPSTYGLWSDYFGAFCERLERKNKIVLTASAKYQLEGLTNGYQSEIVEFINQRTNKLKKPL